jgi:hypothetical protein
MKIFIFTAIFGFASQLWAQAAPSAPSALGVYVTANHTVYYDLNYLNAENKLIHTNLQIGPQGIVLNNQKYLWNIPDYYRNVAPPLVDINEEIDFLDQHTKGVKDQCFHLRKIQDYYDRKTKTRDVYTTLVSFCPAYLESGVTREQSLGEGAQLQKLKTDEPQKIDIKKGAEFISAAKHHLEQLNKTQFPAESQPRTQVDRGR